MIVATLPTIIDAPRSNRIAIGSTKVKLLCNATGFPPPIISWFRDGIRLQNDSNLRMNATHVLINSFDSVHQGIYQCVAENAAGEEQAVALLSLTGISSLKAVTNVKCFPVNYTVYLVTFDAESKVNRVAVVCFRD